MRKWITRLSTRLEHPCFEKVCYDAYSKLLSYRDMQGIFPLSILSRLLSFHKGNTNTDIPTHTPQYNTTQANDPARQDPKQSKHIPKPSNLSPPSSKFLTNNLHHISPKQPIMHPTNPLHYILEVERKFTPTKLSISRLRNNTGTPRFTNLEYQGSKILHDIYYDRGDRLCNNGIWIRQRRESPIKIDQMGSDKKQSCKSGEEIGGMGMKTWQAKVKKGGDRINSSFAEIHDHDTILTLLHHEFPLLAGVKRIEDLSILARITCMRETWRINKKLNVVIDQTDFGHVVGEVELEVATQDDSGAGMYGYGGAIKVDRSDVPKTVVGWDEEAELLKSMDKEVGTFMRRYEWAFPVEGRVVGKLSAYFEWLEASKGG